MQPDRERDADISDIAAALSQGYRRLAERYLALATEETRLAWTSAVLMLGLVIIVAGMLLSAWLSLNAALLWWVVAARGLSFGAAAMIGFIANLSIAIVLGLYIKALAGNLAFENIRAELARVDREEEGATEETKTEDPKHSAEPRSTAGPNA